MLDGITLKHGNSYTPKKLELKLKDSELIKEMYIEKDKLYLDVISDAHTETDLVDILKDCKAYFIHYNKELIGYITLGLDDNDLSVALEYYITPKYRGRGIVTELLGDLIKKVFTRNQEMFVYACIASENIKSINLVERLGFVRDNKLKVRYPKELSYKVYVYRLAYKQFSKKTGFVISSVMLNNILNDIKVEL